MCGVGSHIVSSNVHLWRAIEGARRRARFVVVDPYRSRTAEIADTHLAPAWGPTPPSPSA